MLIQGSDTNCVLVSDLAQLCKMSEWLVINLWPLQDWCCL